VLGGDPALVESTSLGTSSDSRAICANNRDLVGRVDLLGSLRGSLSALAALTPPLLLREQSRDPGVVDEVAGAAEGGEEEEVEEDAVELLLVLRFQWECVFISRTYICGSNQLIGASTMLTVSL
jgi:hypothetical protein